MTCRFCQAHWCWVCQGDWAEHGSATGGYYSCNIYEDMKKKKEFVKEE